MNDRESPAVIDAAAARWVARLDRHPGDGALSAACAEWMAGDRRRRGAFVRAQAVWASLDEAPATEAASSSLLTRRHALVAGGMLAIAGLAAAAWQLLPGDVELASALGERRLERLPDGSRMLLNTDSRSRVKISPDERTVTLEQGEVWFQVAKDPARPFVVKAGAIRVEAVGTAFSVRRFADRAQVVVSEGRVRTWSAAKPARFLLLDAGRQGVVRFDEGAAAAEVAEGGVADALAWRHGEIVLDGMSLGDAASEFNRYNRRQLAIDAHLSETRLVGRFRTDGVDSFATAAAATSGGRIETEGDVIRIVR